MPSGNPNMGTNTVKSTNVSSQYGGGSLGVSSSKMQSTASPTPRSGGGGNAPTPSRTVSSVGSGRSGDTRSPTGPRGPLGGDGQPKSAPGSLGATLARAADPSGGLYDSIRASGREGMAARVNAVSRGPGVLEGTLPANPFGRAKEAQKRTATSLALSQADRFGLPTDRARELTHQMTKAVAGEAGGLSPVEQAAVARTMANRLALGHSPQAMLRAYDATGMDDKRGTEINSAYTNAEPGTKSYAEGLHALASGLSEYGSLQDVPDAIKNATHYLNEKTTKPTASAFRTWAKPGTGTKFGAHTFFTPDNPQAQVQTARLGPAAPAAPVTPTRIADATPVQPEPPSPVAPLTLAAPIPQKDLSVEQEAPEEDLPPGVDVESALKTLGFTEVERGGLFAKTKDKKMREAGIPDNVQRIYTTKDGRVGVDIKTGALAGLDNVRTPEAPAAAPVGIVSQPIAPRAAPPRNFAQGPAPVISAPRRDLGIDVVRANVIANLQRQAAERQGYAHQLAERDRTPVAPARDIMGDAQKEIDRSQRATRAAQVMTHLLNERAPRMVPERTYRSLPAYSDDSRQRDIYSGPTPPSRSANAVVEPSLNYPSPISNKDKKRDRLQRFTEDEFSMHRRGLVMPNPEALDKPNYVSHFAVRPSYPGTNTFISAVKDLEDGSVSKPSTIETTEEALSAPQVITKLGVKPATEPKSFLNRVVSDLRKKHRGNSRDASRVASYILNRVANEDPASSDFSMLDPDAWYRWLISQQVMPA
jgi:hypothetical protein